jgi:hypothetical protein
MLVESKEWWFIGCVFYYGHKIIVRLLYLTAKIIDKADFFNTIGL